MPDPVAYLKALLAAAVASALIVLAFRLVRRRFAQSAAAAICVLSVSAGLATGYAFLQFSWSWPPASALSRFLTIVLPAAVVIELLTAAFGTAGQFFRSTRGVAPQCSGIRENSPHFPRATLLSQIVLAGLRLGLCASVGRILLHGSVYLSGVGNGNPVGWTLTQSLAMFCAGFCVLIATWFLLDRLSHRSGPASITFSLAMSILCAGITTMMAGYIRGGAAAIPLAAALVGTTLALPLLCRSTRVSAHRCSQGPVGIGVIGLFSLLLIGRFFGQLNSESAIVIFLSPLMCWISEIPKRRPTTPRHAATIRFIAVAIPLAAVLFAAKRDFDQKMGPLLAALDLRCF